MNKKEIVKCDVCGKWEDKEHITICLIDNAVRCCNCCKGNCNECWEAFQE